MKQTSLVNAYEVDVDKMFINMRVHMENKASLKN